MTPFWGPENGPIFGSEKPEKRAREIIKTITLRFSFVVLTDTVTLRQRAEYPATETQQMSPFIGTELPKTNCHLCLRIPTHDIRQAKTSRLRGSRN